MLCMKYFLVHRWPFGACCPSISFQSWVTAVNHSLHIPCVLTLVPFFVVHWFPHSALSSTGLTFFTPVQLQTLILATSFTVFGIEIWRRSPRVHVPNLRTQSCSVAWPAKIVLGAQNIWFSMNNTILFEIPPLKAQNDYIC